MLPTPPPAAPGDEEGTFTPAAPVERGSITGALQRAFRGGVGSLEGLEPVERSPAFPGFDVMPDEPGAFPPGFEGEAPPFPFPAENGLPDDAEAPEFGFPPIPAPAPRPDAPAEPFDGENGAPDFGFPPIPAPVPPAESPFEDDDILPLP